MKQSFFIVAVTTFWFAVVAAMPLRAAEPPAGEFALRSQLYIVGSHTMMPYVEAAVGHFVAKHQQRRPVVETRPTTLGIRAFCGGVGVEWPDVLAVSRRLSRAELKACAASDVENIVEIVIGYGAAVVVAQHGTPTINLTPELLYRAIAQDVPGKEEFVDNPYKNWKDINPSLPDLDIAIFGPPALSGTRSVFDDRVLQAGCRYVPEVRAIYAAADRVKACTTPRDDGRFTEVAEGTSPLDVLRGAPAGAMMIVDRAQWIADPRGLEVFPVGGLLPTERSIGNDEYILSRRLYFYFKTAHIRDDRKGYGVARGLRDFMAEVTGDQAMEPGGYFEHAGLILLPMGERARQRLEAISLTPMTR